MKKWFVFAGLATICLGCLWHFLYIWWDHALVAPFAPIDESVWEHLKLLYWPVIPAALILGRKFGRRSVWSGFLCAMLLMPLGMIAVYYTLAAGFGLDSLVLHIGLYILIMICGFVLAYHLTESRKADRWLGELLMITAIYGCALVFFTLAVPELPIFLPPAK